MKTIQDVLRDLTPPQDVWEGEVEESIMTRHGATCTRMARYRVRVLGTGSMDVGHLEVQKYIVSRHFGDRTGRMWVRVDCPHKIGRALTACVKSLFIHNLVYASNQVVGTDTTVNWPRIELEIQGMEKALKYPLVLFRGQVPNHAAIYRIVASESDWDRDLRKNVHALTVEELAGSDALGTERWSLVTDANAKQRIVNYQVNLMLQEDVRKQRQIETLTEQVLDLEKIRADLERRLADAP